MISKKNTNLKKKFGWIFKEHVLTLFLIVAAFFAISEFNEIASLRAIKIEEYARENLNAVASDLDLIFSQTDTLINLVLPLWESGAGYDEIVAAINDREGHYLLEGIYLLDANNLFFVSNSNSGFQISDALPEKPLMLQKENSGHDIWGGPIFDAVLNKRVIYRKVSLGNSLQKIVFVYSIHKVAQEVHNAKLKSFGILYMIDDSTNFIFHPLSETRSLLQLGYDFNDEMLIKLSLDVIHGRELSSNYWHINTVSGQKSNEALKKLKSTGWWLGLSVYSGKAIESAVYQTVMRGKCISLILYVGAFLMLLFIILQNKIKRSKLIVAFSYPVILLLMLITVISVYNYYPQQSKASAEFKHFMKSDSEKTWRNLKDFKWDFKRLISYGSLNSFIAGHNAEAEILHGEPTKIIPTGIYIHSADFTNPYTIRIVGTLWQKYLVSGNPYPDRITEKYIDCAFEKKGITFPGAYVSIMEETDIMETTLEDYPAKLYRWNFDVEVVQEISNVLYPFGKNNLTLIILSNDLDSDIVLTPDLASYKQLYPTDKPGLGNNFNLKLWNTTATYFNYNMAPYFTTWGNTNYQEINNFPELEFNISISRKFSDILIGRIIPLMLVLLLLFVIVFVRDKKEGFNNIIGCSSLFFVLMLDHINLRETVLSDAIMFLEFFYFLSYAIMLFISITSFDTFKREESNKLTDSVIKRYFWTFVIGTMLAITIMFFG